MLINWKDLLSKYSDVSESKKEKVLKQILEREKSSSKRAIDFIRKESHEKYYFLGYIAADGHITYKGNGNFIFTCFSIDKEVVVKFANWLGVNWKEYSKKGENTRNQFYVGIKNPEFGILMQEIFGNKKSGISRYMQGKEEYMGSFLAGVFDGDGCISGYHLDIFAVETSIKEVIEYGLGVLGIKFGKRVKQVLSNGNEMIQYAIKSKSKAIFYNKVYEFVEGLERKRVKVLEYVGRV